MSASHRPRPLDARLEFQLATRDLALLRAAALHSRMSVSALVRSSALATARKVLAEEPGT